MSLELTILVISAPVFIVSYVGYLIAEAADWAGVSLGAVVSVVLSSIATFLSFWAVVIVWIIDTVKS